MRKTSNFIFSLLFVFIIIFGTTTNISDKAMSASLEANSSGFIKKVSRSYTNKFCNSIGFGLSKESAMKFSLQENNQVFKKRKEMKYINKDLLAEEIAISVVEKCGYPIELSGEEGIQQFKNYYLSKDNSPN